MKLNEILLFQQNLALKYKYKKLNQEISKYAQDLYRNNIPIFLNINGDDNFVLYSKDNTPFSIGYNRIVIGDYGAFIEFDKSQLIKKNIQPKKGQEYRYKDLKFRDNVKYYWYTTIDNSDIKIYYQKKIVSYADYLPGMFYVSPLEIKE
jgi:hypothetical protein